MSKKQKIGLVVSTKMNKSIVITTNTRYKHPLYRKIMTKTQRYFAHDPENICKIGNKVLIEECAPISAKKKLDFKISIELEV